MEVALIVCTGWIFSVCLHEFGHAIVAYWGGDTTVKDKGYLTFNIFKYTDPGMTLFFPVLILILGGIALPGAAVYIDHRRLRSKLWESAVSAAGPLMTLTCAGVFSLPFYLHWFPPFVPDEVWTGLAFLIMLEVFAFVLNSLPVPPFDGFGVIEPWLPVSVRVKVNQMARYSMWMVFIVLWTVQPINNALWDVVIELIKIAHVPVRIALRGQTLFQQNAGWLVIFLLLFLFLMKRGEKSPSAVPDNSPGAEQLYQVAKQLLSENRPVDAVAALNQALTIDQSMTKAWVLRGVCFGLMNRNDDAMQNFNQAVRLDPLSADAWYNRACCNALQGKYDLALGDLSEAVKLNPQSIKQHALQDPGFMPLRNDARFKLLMS